MRIAIISDVHGNALALDAVLDHVCRASPDLVVNLGDLVSGPFDPKRAADVQMGLNGMTIAGNHERQLLEHGTGASDVLARPQLSAEHVSWIAGLPKSLTLADGEVFACHGSPAGGDLEYLLEDVSSGRAVLDTQEAIVSRLRGIGRARVVLCGHTHIPRIASVADILVVNPGSVGMPAYQDDAPVQHVMEVGSPHARYAFIERLAAGWTADLRAVPYDWDAAARQAEAYGRSATASSTKTGRMPVDL